MKHKIPIFYRIYKSFFLPLSLIIVLIMLFGCSSTKSLRVSPFYYFDYNRDNCRIRSISSSDKTQSRNELLGNDFMAYDTDQDGTLDQIVLGEIPLSEAQKIYDYALNKLNNENKLREINPDDDKYQYVNSKYTYEIRTFRPVNGKPFNQFKVIKNYQIANQIPVVMIDKNADGKLDAVLKGDVGVEKFQKKYDELLKKGLQNQEFIMVDNRILVNEK